jgi:hypothetical protein
VAVACALSIAACSSNAATDATPVATAEPTEETDLASSEVTEPATTVHVTSSSVTLPEPVGATSLTAADGSALPEAQFTTVTDAVPRPEGFTPASAPVDVAMPDGLVSAPVRLSLPGSAPPTGALPMVLHRNDVGWWEAVPAEYIDGSYTADVLSFSLFWPGWAATTADWILTTAGNAVDAAGNIIDSGFDWVTGRTDAPQPCGSDPYPWVASSGAPPDGAFHVCLEQNPRADGTERVEVKIKSNRAFAMWVVVPRTGADYVWVEGSSWDAIGPTLLAYTGGGSDRVLLGAGRTLTVGYTQPSAAASQRFFAYQDNITQIMSLLTRNVGESNAVIGTLLATIGCFDTGVTSIGDLTWDRAWNCLGSLLGASANQVELALDKAISSGRIALSSADREAFGAAVLKSNRLSTTLTALKKVAAVLGAARLAADAVVLANDAALGLVEGAGELTVDLVSPVVGLSASGFGTALFGEEAETAIAYISARLGPQTDDSGWFETGYDPNSQDDQCHSPFMRTMRWGNLFTVFADYEPGVGVSQQRNFVYYSYAVDEQGSDLLGLATDRGLRLGDPLAQVTALYPAASIDSGFFFEANVVFGMLAPNGTVRSLEAGTDMCPV